MVREEAEQSEQANSSEISENVDNLFSPRFKSAAAMAGWDEEALIVASLVVEDTPDCQQSKHKRRFDSLFVTPQCISSRRKRRAHRNSPVSTPIAPLNFDEEQKISKQESEKKSMEEKIVVEDEKKTEANEPAIHCMDKLREELSCAICLDICFEPSTTSCGHSFCKKCLRSAADKCGKRCPKCRQLISNGRSCTVNTVLWNTIQLLFPKEVEARKAAAAALNSKDVECQSPGSGIRSSTRRTRTRARVQDPALVERLQREDLSRLVTNGTRRRGNMSQDDDASLAAAARLQRDDDISRLVHTGRRRRGTPSQDEQRDDDISRLVHTGRRRRGTPSQDEDAALALRLQRVEFMEAFRGNNGHQQTRIPVSLARANLRAMASRAINRGRPV